VVSLAISGSSTTNSLQDLGYFYQIIRWKRSTAQMMITNLFINPGFWARDTSSAAYPPAQ
jgi:hypothetical protein